MTALLANNATSTLASAITDTDTTVVLATSDGASFPSPTGDEWFPLTLRHSSSLEIVRVTARSGDSLQVVRAQEGTTAQAFSVGDSAKLRFTEAVHSSYGQAADIALAVSDHAATNDHPLATTIAKGFLSAVDKTKIDTVEEGATADQTKADIDALGVDAETLDGISSLGFDLAGDADTAVSNHVALPDPHSQYTKTTDLATVATSGSYGDLSGIADDLELKRYNETVATGSATLDRADGGIQTFTMTANITLAVTIAAGEALTFHLSAGDTYTVTWPTITWVGGSAPVLTAADVIEFWKVGSTLYGAYVGAV